MSKASDFFGGGGSGIPINGVLPLNVSGVDLFEDTDGASWLKSGIVETDTVTYPDANTDFDGVLSKSILGTFTPSLGITYKDSKYIRLSSSAQVYQHNLDGSGITLLFDDDRDRNIRGIDFADGFFWLAGEGTDSVIKYNSTNTFDSKISIAPETTTPTEITILGSSMYIINASLSIHKRNKFTGAAELLVNPDLTGFDTIRGLAAANGFLYVLFVNNSGVDVVKEFNATTILPTGRSFTVGNSADIGTNSRLGINTDNGNMIYNSGPNLYEYAFGDLIGIVDAKTDTDTSLPIYTRIK